MHACVVGNCDGGLSVMELRNQTFFPGSNPDILSSLRMSRIVDLGGSLDFLSF